MTPEELAAKLLCLRTHIASSRDMCDDYELWQWDTLTKAAEAIRQARAEALEEAAKLIERQGQAIGGAIQPGRAAANIRALKEQQ